MPEQPAAPASAGVVTTRPEPARTVFEEWSDNLADASAAVIHAINTLPIVKIHQRLAADMLAGHVDLVFLARALLQRHHRYGVHLSWCAERAAAAVEHIHIARTDHDADPTDLERAASHLDDARTAAHEQHARTHRFTGGARIDFCDPRLSWDRALAVTTHAVACAVKALGGKRFPHEVTVDDLRDADICHRLYGLMLHAYQVLEPVQAPPTARAALDAVRGLAEAHRRHAAANHVAAYEDLAASVRWADLHMGLVEPPQPPIHPRRVTAGPAA